MAMKAGSVLVATDGSYSGTDLAKALMDAHVAAAETLVENQSPGATSHLNVKVALRQGLALMANAYATALVAYLQANARAVVTTQVLARVPAQDPVPPGASVLPPATPVEIPIA
jgi:hypothetical protein